MKKVLFAIVIALFLGCGADSDNSQISENRLSQVTPVYNLNGLYSKTKGKHYVNIQWYTDYGFPNLFYTPHYITIKKDGILVADFYQEQFNRFSVQVPSNWQQSTFEVTQTVQGLGVSAPAFVTVYRTY